MNKNIKTNYTVDKCVTAVVLALAICAIVGISLFPSEYTLVNVLVYCSLTYLAGSEFLDIFRIRAAEKFAQQLVQKLNERQNKED